MTTKSKNRNDLKSQIKKIVLSKVSSIREELSETNDFEKGSKFIFEISIDDISGIESTISFEEMTKETIEDLFPKKRVNLSNLQWGDTIVVSIPTEELSS